MSHQNEKSNHNVFLDENGDPQQANFFRHKDRQIPILMIIERPLIVLMQDFLSGYECDELISLSKEKLHRSTVVSRDDGSHVVDDVRTSSGCSFSKGQNLLISRIEERISTVTETRVEQGEGLQVLHYKPGQEYKPHYDYFSPEEIGESVHMKHGGQRIGTFLMYLNDVPSGGATSFPNLGLHIAAKKGSALFFRYCQPYTEDDALTLHSGMPVETGEKWIATKWLRENDYV